MQKLQKFLIGPLFWAILYGIACVIFLTEAIAAQHARYVFPFVGLGGAFRPHDLEVLGIPAYWFLMAIGVAVTLLLCICKREEYGLGKLSALLFPIGFFFVSFVGGTLLNLFEQNVLLGSKAFIGDGLSLFGAVFLIPAAAALFGLSDSFSTPRLLDLCALLGLTLLVFVRTGCFISGCCGGPLLHIGGNPVYLPVQLIEVVLDLLTLEVCLRVRQKRKSSGWMYPTFAVLYGTYRFLLEFLRNNPRQLGFFTYAQLWAVLCILMGIALGAWRYKKCGSEKTSYR